MYLLFTYKLLDTVTYLQINRNVGERQFNDQWISVWRQKNT